MDVSVRPSVSVLVPRTSLLVDDRRYTGCPSTSSPSSVPLVKKPRPGSCEEKGNENVVVCVCLSCSKFVTGTPSTKTLLTSHKQSSWGPSGKERGGRSLPSGHQRAPGGPPCTWKTIRVGVPTRRPDPSWSPRRERSTVPRCQKSPFNPYVLYPNDYSSLPFVRLVILPCVSGGEFPNQCT